MSDERALEEARLRLARSPFHQWLGLQLVALGEDTVELRATWREDWVVNPERRNTHGGVLAALIDIAADWSLTSRLGRAVPTIDIRVDYHRFALPGDLLAKGRVVKFGGQFSVCESQVLDLDGQLLASGRGTYLTAPPRG
ncbi:MAG: PaaI family thioesterase [Burkholderiales bacterium]